MFTKKLLFMLVIVLCMVTIIHAQSKGTIVFTSRPAFIDSSTGESPDMPHIYALQNAGYEVIKFHNASLSTASQETMDTLLNANLIVMGRSTPSTTFGDHKQAWNELPTPILNLELWNCRSSRLNWFNTTTMISLTDTLAVYNAIIDVPDDPVFTDIDPSAPVPWVMGAMDAVGVKDAGNGTVLARMETDSTVLFVRFEPDLEFYVGTTDYPAGHRTVLGNGRDNSGRAPFSYYNFTPESETVFLAEVARLVALGGGSSVEDRENTPIPSTLVLYQNYPNPFNPTTTIPFDLPENSHVRLSLINILGEKTTEIVNGEYSAGHHEIVFTAKNLASGVYFYKIETERYISVKKLVIFK